VEPASPYDPIRDDDTGLLNGPALRATLVALAESVAVTVNLGEVPIVLAGDCSVVLGGLLGLRRARRTTATSDRVGLLFVDGHVDFYQPEASPTGEVADMDLALATGRGPALLAQLDGDVPLVREHDVVALGARDAEERNLAGSQDVRTTGIHLFELDEIRLRDMSAVADDALAVLQNPELSGFWLHLDADVLDDRVMPAVDYRQPGGLTPTELTLLLRRVASAEGLSGLSVAIYNPALDDSGAAGQALVDCMVDGLAHSSGSSIS
jgi:arginase